MKFSCKWKKWEILTLKTIGRIHFARTEEIHATGPGVGGRYHDERYSIIITLFVIYEFVPEVRPAAEYPTKVLYSDEYMRSDNTLEQRNNETRESQQEEPICMSASTCSMSTAASTSSSSKQQKQAAEASSSRRSSNKQQQQHSKTRNTEHVHRRTAVSSKQRLLSRNEYTCGTQQGGWTDASHRSLCLPLSSRL